MVADPNPDVDIVVPEGSAKNSRLTGVHPLGDGLASFLARNSTINAAEKSIDLQYYIFKNDAAGKILVWSLVKAANRGVRVRILLDDMESRSDRFMQSVNRHENIEVRLFNPFINRRWRNVELVSNFGRLNHRMHNKSLTIDGKVSVVGGRNIGNEYFAYSAKANFYDFDFLIVGAALTNISKQFDLYWNSVFSYPVHAIIGAKVDENAYVNDMKTLELEAERLILNHGSVGQPPKPILQQLKGGDASLYWGNAKLLYDTPRKILGKESSPEPTLAENLRDELDQATEKVLIISPYFIPGKLGTKKLIDLATRGVDVRIVTNSLASTDVVAVHASYKKYRKRLLRGGVKIYEIKVDVEDKSHSWKGSSGASLHAKMFIFDEQSTFVGSFNLDPRSIHLNTEMGLIIENPELAISMEKKIGDVLNRNSYKLILNQKGKLRWRDLASGLEMKSEPDAGVWRRIRSWFSSFLPIEGQL